MSQSLASSHSEQRVAEEKLSRKHVFKRLLGYTRPHWRGLSSAFLVLLLATGADLVGPILVQTFIDDYLTPGLFDWQAIVFLAALYICLHLTSVALTYYQSFSFQKIAQYIIQQLRMDVFSKVQHLGLSFFDRTPGGSLVSRITNDTEAIKELYISVLAIFLQSTVFLLGIFVAMFYLDTRLALFCLALLPLIIAVMSLYRRLSSQAYHITRQKLSLLNAKLNESLQGMGVIQAFRQQQRLRDEYYRITDEHYKAHLKTVRFNGLLLRPATDLIYLVAIVLVLGYFGHQSFLSGVEIGVVWAFVTYLDRFFEPVNMMMMRLSQLQQALVAGERVFGLLDETELAPGQQGTGNPVITSGHIEFRDVTFSYDGKVNVLKNISFEAKPGQTVALVGHTGSGKSSIVNLLLRFYPLKQGQILIDGVPLEHYKDEELRKKVGLVLQDPFLFVGDIRSNITLNDPSFSEQDVQAAARFVQADSFIEKLPRTYQEPVGERGATYSSGQRQLISYARTMVRNPKILVLDEATASVDTETEEAIQEALANMRQGRTTIAIAHRLSTIQEADLILVLHKGEIIERGTHQELLAKKGLYYKMYLLQHGINEKLSVQG
ncbi:ATP-binding cassette subfamily B protein [Caldalkalibacillus uzonensis]|uniref:ATP-binding cassette subfamily B protein n=1 Tax=Caldalkalibacillus uzonensis TaxID=353224 RepID=A0ABU0CNX7_9BACI|nr:ABC transporter ATP-binding protein [Caldalkalibacillus uzonensis]MDQ0337594.1 ATP-binding cassette subfamily B protein [Caldalkalibacillus uzonensis]